MGRVRCTHGVKTRVALRTGQGANPIVHFMRQPDWAIVPRSVATHQSTSCCEAVFYMRLILKSENRL